MKKTFDILALSPTQWVLVDKTRIPRDGEPYCHLIERLGSYCLDQRAVIHDSFYRPGLDLPILAAYPKIEIEGVLLLPAKLWEKKPLVSDNDLACEIVARSASPGKRSIIDRKMKMFAQGAKWMQERYEAAGGYTRQDMIRFGKLCAEYEHLKMQGKAKGIKFTNELLEDFAADSQASPRSLEIDVNEDGSMPSENGMIIYKEVIY